MRAVEEKERAREYSGRRGPTGETRKHWYEPKAIVEPGREPNRWQFKCKYAQREFRFWIVISDKLLSDDEC